MDLAQQVMFAPEAQVMRQLRLSDALRLCRKVMCCIPLSTRKTHITCEASITSIGHITFRAAEHIVQKTPFVNRQKAF